MMSIENNYQKLTRIFEITDALIVKEGSEINPFSDDLLDWLDTLDRDRIPISFEEFIENKNKL